MLQQHINQLLRKAETGARPAWLFMATDQGSGGTVISVRTPDVIWLSFYVWCAPSSYHQFRVVYERFCPGIPIGNGLDSIESRFRPLLVSRDVLDNAENKERYLELASVHYLQVRNDPMCPKDTLMTMDTLLSLKLFGAINQTDPVELLLGPSRGINKIFDSMSRSSSKELPIVASPLSAWMNIQQLSGYFEQWLRTEVDVVVEEIQSLVIAGELCLSASAENQQGPSSSCSVMETQASSGQNLSSKIDCSRVAQEILLFAKGYLDQAIREQHIADCTTRSRHFELILQRLEILERRIDTLDKPGLFSFCGDILKHMMAALVLDGTGATEVARGLGNIVRHAF